ncbi:MAG: hypothetical protein LBU32_23130 [Clostridiales bacterium]|nr:hypothetical protein [Clostridiales bacterium]
MTVSIFDIISECRPSCRLQLEIVRRNSEIEAAGKFEPDLPAFLSKAGGSRSGELAGERREGALPAIAAVCRPAWP